MTIEQMHTGVRLEIDKSGTLDSVGFEPEEIDYWLNTAISSLVKTKYSGSISTRGAFEQNQKRIDDLRALVEETTLDVSTTDAVKPNCFVATLPSSPLYWFTLGEEVDILIPISTSAPITAGAEKLTANDWYLVVTEAVNNRATYAVGTYFQAVGRTLDSGTVYPCTVKRQGVTQSTADTYRTQIDNPYSEHVLEGDEAKPLRLFRGDLIELVTDGNYGVSQYHLRYLRKPAEVDVDGAPAVDCDLPEHVHDEVVRLAANMILENIESQRYNTHSYEVRKTE